MSKILSIGAVLIAAAVGLIAFWFLVPRAASFGMFQQEGGPNSRTAIQNKGAPMSDLSFRRNNISSIQRT